MERLHHGVLLKKSTVTKMARLGPVFSGLGACDSMD